MIAGLRLTILNKKNSNLGCAKYGHSCYLNMEILETVIRNGKLKTNYNN
ncbi:hypothetical protein BMETH_1244_0 [methanotrophic bacterial endosymbiont of Bathymodiolus sp.]|nr:hypothetical protein BMETH_1244_0 [methanotrophic bacterial endosymbiont of Bathymodiolus sp.]